MGKGSLEGSLTKLHAHELQAIAIDCLTQKVSSLEDKLKLFQDMVMDDSAYQSQVSDLNSWLEQQKNRPDPLADLYDTSDSVQNIHSGSESKADQRDTKMEKKESKAEVKKKESKVEQPATTKTTDGSEKAKKKDSSAKEKPKRDSGEVAKPNSPPKTERSEDSKERNHDFEQEIMTIFEEEYTEIVSVAGSPERPFSSAELQHANNKLKNLAFVLNDQLVSVRDKIFGLDHELKRMAKGVEFALMRAKVAGMNELVSKTSFLSTPIKL